MKKTVLLALCASSLGLGACGLDIPDYNNPSLESLQDTPTRASIEAAATGLLLGNRAGISAQTGYVAHLGILGRESFTLDAADPRYVTEMVRGEELDPGSPAFGGSLWANPYANIRNANTLLAAMEKVTELSGEEKKALQGFAKTIQALDFLVVINTRDENGAPIDVGGGIDKLGAIESKDKVFEHIATLLDQAKADLEEGGEEFPFRLSSGYEGFDTPATFIPFNRAIKARVEVYRGNFTSALTALGESFLDTAEPLTLGVYHAYSTGSGDAPNGLNNVNIFANPTLVTEAEQKAGGGVDDRVTRKIKTVDEVKYDDNLISNVAFKMYESNSAPVPLIRNEELILLRAEANIGLGFIETAAEDINLIRTTSGGLGPITDLTAATALDELLKQKRYSLLFEGGHRWIDLRRYGKLDTLDLAGGRIHSAFPIPKSETDARQ